MAQKNSQTQFSLEEPLFEQMGQLPPEPETEEVVKAKIPWYKQKKLLALIITISTIVILLLLFVINQFVLQGRLPGISEIIDREEEVVDRTSHPIMQRIIAADRELQAADPTKRELGYPTLDYTLHLDQPSRR